MSQKLTDGLKLTADSPKADSPKAADRSPDVPATLPTPWERIGTSIDRAGKIGHALLAFAAGAAVLIFAGNLVYSAWNPHKPVLMEAFAVPETLQTQGYTPALLSDMLQDNIQQMQRDSKSSLDSPALRQDVGNQVPDVEVTDMKISLSALVQYLTAHTSTHTDGALVQSRQRLHLMLHYRPGPQDTVPAYSVDVSGALPPNQDPEGVTRTLNVLMHQTALRYLEHTNPYLAAAYYYHAEQTSTKPAVQAHDKNRAWALTRQCLADRHSERASWALDLQGVMLADAGQAVRAEQKYVEALRTAHLNGQRFATPLYNSGKMLFGEGRYPEAAAQYEMATDPSNGQGDPQFADAFRDWGAALAAQAAQASSTDRPALLAHAVSLFRKAAEMNPQDAMAQADWAAALQAEGEKGAQQHCLLGLDADPSCAYPYSELGALAVANHHWSHAARWFHLAAGYAPRDPSLRSYFAYAQSQESHP